MDNDRGKSFFDPPTAILGMNEAAGTSLDPIVLDDDDSDSMARKSSPKKRKPSPRPTPSRALPKRRGLISINNDVSGGIASPRIFADFLDSDDEDKTRLENEVATLQAEVSKLKTTLEGVQSDLSGAQLQTKNLSLEKLKLLRKIKQLENLSDQQKGLGDELKRAQSENAQAKQTEETLRRELVTSGQIVQKHKAELAAKKMELQKAEKQASLNEGHVKEKILLPYRIKANQAYDAMKKENAKLTAELEKVKGESTELLALRFKFKVARDKLLTAARDAKETQEQISKLQSELGEAGRERIAFRIQIAKLIHGTAAHEEENEKLAATISKAHEDKKALQLSLETAKKAYEKTKLEKRKANDDLKIFANERAELWRRTEKLEIEKLEYEKMELERMAEKSVAVARQEASRLSGIELDLQAAQQQIEAMNYHMEKCPFVQNPTIWDNCVSIAREVDVILGKSNGRPDESPAHDTPDPSSS